MSEIFSEPDDFGPSRASEATTSLAGSLGAQWADTLDPKDSLSGMWLARRAREASAGGETLGPGAGGDVDVFSGQPLEERQAVFDAQRAAIPDTSIDDAKARVKQEGLEKDLHLPDQPSIKAPVLDLMINEAHDRRDREAAIARGPHGFFPGALGTVTSIGVGMIDPVNAAAFSIPVLGEARMGKIIASAGDSILGRGAVKFGVGAAQGAVGTAALQPADWWLHTRDGQDYTMAQALESVVMGAGMGGAFHAGFGAIGDVRSRMRGAPLEGSPQDLLLRGLMTGTHVHADQLAEEGVSIGEVPGMEAGLPPAAPVSPHPAAQILADLPPAAKEDAVHAAMADVISGKPTNAAEMLEIAADHDPRIAESFEAWHGSPHEVDRFDTSRIGTGEGAQAYGHGLYFAQNEKVALQYQRSTSGQDFIRKAQELYDEYDRPDDAHAAISESKDFTPGQRHLLLALEKDDWLGFDYPHQAVSAALSDPRGKRWEMSPETLDAIKHVGNMYKVRVTANHEHMLDWDKPLSEQTPHVRAALQSLGDLTKIRPEFQAGAEAYWKSRGLPMPEPNGEEVVANIGRNLAGQNEGDRVKASQTLSEAGIPGIKYLDQGSRPIGPALIDNPDGKFWIALRGSPHEKMFPFEDHQAAVDYSASVRGETRNFVIFNDKHIEITHKNGEAVGLDQFKGSPEAAAEKAGQPAIPDLGAAAGAKPAEAPARAAEAAPPEKAPAAAAPPPPDRGARLAAAAADPRWRELADVRPDYDEPEVLEESRAADHVEEPASTMVPERSLTALEKAAADAEAIWRRIEPTLSEEERAMVNTALDQLKGDKEARDSIISDGVACLVGAAA